MYFGYMYMYHSCNAHSTYISFTITCTCMLLSWIQMRLLTFNLSLIQYVSSTCTVVVYLIQLQFKLNSF